tara:strand:- start:213 stop:419 length:207 start_codon:yes stop_codon:yes gene_type:complete
MYIYRDNIIHIFKDKNIDKNILFIKTTDKFPHFSTDKVLSIINLYYSIKKYGCVYSDKIEQEIFNYID